MSRRSCLPWALAVAAALLLAACVSPSPGTPAVSCARLPAAMAATPGLRLTRADNIAADGQGHPAHCLVQGRLGARTGVDSRRYAIGFELRLPVRWNGRLLQQANGGNDGVVKPAFGALDVLATDALSRGFAVVSGDGGHDANDPANAGAGLARGQVFGLDPQARRDYGYAAVQALVPVAQALVERHYGRRPHHNYLAGCSNGGRQAMVAASRNPDLFDGLLAGAPGFDLPKAAVQHAWDVQSWLQVAPDIRQAFSTDDLRRVADRVLERCDGLDLLVDGIIGDPGRCRQTFRLAELQCRDGQRAGCLSPAQVRALQRSFDGPRNSAGDALYSRWGFDAGIAAAGWRRWKLESSIAAWDREPIIAILGAASLAYVFTTPPTPVAGTPAALLDYLARFDFDRDAPKIFATGGGFEPSAMALMAPPDVDDPRLAGFARHGGKLLIYHGNSDPVFAVDDTMRWIERLQAHLGRNGADAVARLFPVPGMGHCLGGPATDRFDALGALVDWVENGRAPDRLLASVNPDNPELPAGWSRDRSRPLCPWPQVARYAGGDVEAAGSFRCAPP